MQWLYFSISERMICFINFKVSLNISKSVIVLTLKWKEIKIFKSSVWDHRLLKNQSLVNVKINHSLWTWASVTNLHRAIKEYLLYILGTAVFQKQTRSVRKVEPEENIKLISPGIGIYLLTDLLPSQGTENQNLPLLPWAILMFLMEPAQRIQALWKHPVLYQCWFVSS